MTETTFTTRQNDSKCKIPHGQFNVRFGLRNHVITEYQPFCAVGNPDISILNAKHTNSVTQNPIRVTITPSPYASPNSVSARNDCSRNVIKYNHGYIVINTNETNVDCGTVWWLHATQHGLRAKPRPPHVIRVTLRFYWLVRSIICAGRGLA
jgi:hypothetical protein